MSQLAESPAGDVDKRSIKIVLPLPDPLLTANWRRRNHWRRQANETKRQRDDAMWTAYAAMADHPETLRAVVFPEGKVRADVTVYRRRNQKVPDEVSEWEWCKPIWDGFESAGVVSNDKQITHGEVVWRPTDPEPRVVIVLTEVQP